MDKTNRNGLHSGSLITGFFIGLLVGGIGALLKAPSSGSQTRQTLGQNLRSAIETVTPADPLVESVAEGKEAARRRLAALGLDH